MDTIKNSSLALSTAIAMFKVDHLKEEVGECSSLLSDLIEMRKFEQKIFKDVLDAGDRKQVDDLADNLIIYCDSYDLYEYVAIPHNHNKKRENWAKDKEIPKEIINQVSLLEKRLKEFGIRSNHIAKARIRIKEIEDTISEKKEKLLDGVKEEQKKYFNYLERY